MHDTLDAPDTWPNWDLKPTLTLSWDTAVTVNRFVLYERHNDAWGADTSNVERVDYTLKDRSGQALQTGTIDSFVADSPEGVELVLPEAVEGVVSAEFAIIYDGEKNYHNVGLGFREVEVYGAQEEEVLPEPDVKITPELGESMIEGGLKWEYFDDRIWNRAMMIIRICMDITVSKKALIPKINMYTPIPMCTVPNSRRFNSVLAAAVNIGCM